MIETSTYPALAAREVPARGQASGLGIAGALSVGVIVVLWYLGNGSLLRLAIPAVSLLFALVLYVRQPIVYVQYSLWVWFLAPLVRRIVDFRFGWTDPNFILLSPFLVSAVAGLAFLKKDGKAWRDTPTPFFLCAAAILYGFAVGFLLEHSAETIFGLLNWLCPVLFGFHLYVNWPRYQEHSAAILRTFLWAVLILGVYGIYQFLSPGAWDRYWLESVNLTPGGGSFGSPEPLLVRVWSTMNAPGPFANTMMVGLLLLFAVQSPFKLPAAIAGYTSFLLSIVRTAWLSWVVGLVWILKSSKPRVVIRAILSMALLVVCLVPVVSDPQIAPVASDRLKTFKELGSDESFGTRTEMYRVLASDVLENPFGHGLKSNMEVSHGMAVDSGILITVFSLGWMGSALFAAGIVSLFLGARTMSGANDDFLNVAKAGLIAILVQIVGGNIFVNVTGVMFWMFAGMYLAAFRYHENEIAITEQSVVAEGMIAVA
jgi:hypothetical protein